MARNVVTHWLQHPLTRGMSIDDPRTTALRRQIIQGKPFLRKLYRQWYEAIAAAVPDGAEPALELGSGAGFLREFVDHLITSDVFATPGVDLVLDGRQLPFSDGTLRAILMVDVLHHIPAARRFFSEAARCVRPGGRVVMIEPWVSAWSGFVYRRFHHEPFDPAAAQWEFPATGPLSGANMALPWIMFQRDRAQFEREFPQWQVKSIRPCTPFCYLLSGGVSMRSLCPGFAFGLWRGVEAMVFPLRNQLSMFAQITLVRATRI
jgi:SAM-dependent methyltransferase